MSAVVVEILPWRDGLWRWRFRDPNQGLILPSNRAYQSRQEAEEAAGLAYPGVTIAAPQGTAGARIGLAVMGTTTAGAVLVAATGAGAAIMVAVVLGRVGMRIHKLRRSTSGRRPR